MKNEQVWLRKSPLKAGGRYVLLGLACLWVSACHKPVAVKNGGRTVGFCQEGEENDWRTAESKSMRWEAQKRGIDLKYVNAGGDQEKQIKAMRTFIAQHVDAIILAPRVETGWDPVLREAQSARIPVILVDRGVSAPPDLYTTLIASDFVDEGKRAGEWLAKQTSGSAKIVQLEGTAGSAPAIDRKKGFEQAIAMYPGMKVVASQDGDFQLRQGKEVMAAFLKSLGKENITAVYAHNDNMALGAIQAITEAGLTPGKDILILSIDGIHDGLAALLDGKINCVVECNPLLAPPAFDSVEAAQTGKPLPKHQVQKDELFDKSNFTAPLLAARQY